MYIHTKFKEAGGSAGPPVATLPAGKAKIKEEQFYEPFADWLVNEMEECTKAIVLGGNRFRDKWGTPDVIGKRESKRSDIIQAPVEIVSAEIKPDVYQLVTAFGQACAYCLFSHKVYLVVSNKTPDDEIARIDALCQVFGLGFVLFDSDNAKDPRSTVYHSRETAIPKARLVLRQSIYAVDRARNVLVAAGGRG